MCSRKQAFFSEWLLISDIQKSLPVSLRSNPPKVPHNEILHEL